MYVQLIWRNNSGNMPNLIISEIDEQNVETRKIEFFNDGYIGYAYDNIEFCELPERHFRTGLSDQPFPRLDDINKDKDFFAVEITKDEFEAAWNKFVLKQDK